MWGPGGGWSIIKEEEHSMTILMTQSHEDQTMKYEVLRRWPQKILKFKKNEDSKTLSLYLVKMRHLKQ